MTGRNISKSTFYTSSRRKRFLILNAEGLHHWWFKTFICSIGNKIPYFIFTAWNMLNFHGCLHTLIALEIHLEKKRIWLYIAVISLSVPVAIVISSTVKCIGSSLALLFYCLKDTIATMLKSYCTCMYMLVHLIYLSTFPTHIAEGTADETKFWSIN